MTISGHSKLMLRCWQFSVLLTLVTAIASVPHLGLPAVGYSLRFTKAVPARWLELREKSGTVTIQVTGQSSRPARLGDRLVQVGDRFSTGAKSDAVLAVDQGAAIIRLTENTIVQVQKLQIDAAGGNITVLSVPKGMARLQVRPFNRPTSRLDIQTPSGVAGVRGTEYGVIVTPSGKTTVATQTGAVAVSAQNQTQTVRTEQYSLVQPGSPPTPPQQLIKDLKLTLLHLQPVIGDDKTITQAEVVGQVNPANAVLLNGELIDTTLSGEFTETVSVSAQHWISILVRASDGAEQLYKIFVSPTGVETPTTIELYP